MSNYKQPSWLGKRHDWHRITNEQLAVWKQEIIEHQKHNEFLYQKCVDVNKDLVRQAIGFYGQKSPIVKAMIKFRVPQPPDLVAEYNKVVKKVHAARAATQRELSAQHDHLRRSEAAKRGAETRRKHELEQAREEYVNSFPQSD